MTKSKSGINLICFLLNILGSSFITYNAFSGTSEKIIIENFVTLFIMFLFSSASKIFSLFIIFIFSCAKIVDAQAVKHGSSHLLIPQHLINAVTLIIAICIIYFLINILFKTASVPVKPATTNTKSKSHEPNYTSSYSYNSHRDYSDNSYSDYSYDDYHYNTGYSSYNNPSDSIDNKSKDPFWSNYFDETRNYDNYGSYSGSSSYNENAGEARHYDNYGSYTGSSSYNEHTGETRHYDNYGSYTGSSSYNERTGETRHYDNYGSYTGSSSYDERTGETRHYDNYGSYTGSTSE